MEAATKAVNAMINKKLEPQEAITISFLRCALYVPFDRGIAGAPNPNLEGFSSQHNRKVGQKGGAPFN